MLVAVVPLFALGSACRDPLKQPFSSTSIWNTPLGNAAKLVDVGLAEFATGQFHVDTNYIVPQGGTVVDIVNQVRNVLQHCPNRTKG
jgi:hypothetical protein